MADTTTEPSKRPPADVAGTRIGDVIVNLGYATRDEVETAFAAQKAEKASWQKLQKDNPDVSEADLAKQHPDQVVQQLGQLLKDETKGRVTEQEIQDSVALQKDLRKEFQDKHPSPDEVTARTHELAKEKGIEDKSTQHQAKADGWLDCTEVAQATTIDKASGRSEAMRQQFADNSIRVSIDQGGKAQLKGDDHPHVS
jgi:hypothetical protein